MELNNYRPISVLNIFSKIFERLMYNRLIVFFLISIISFTKINLDLEKGVLPIMPLLL